MIPDRKNRSFIGLAVLTVFLVGVACAALLYAAPRYRRFSAGGESLVKAAMLSDAQVQSGFRQMSYRELSDAYAALEPTCEAWTKLTPEEKAEGVPGGLYFISLDNLEFCIYNTDSEQIGEAQYSLADFDHIWLNSENDHFYVVVNLAGKNIDLSGYYVLAREASGLYASRVLINCYEAETVDLTDCIFYGTLLAPDAAVQFGDTYLYGQVLARETAGTLRANRGIGFTGYEAITEGLTYVDFQNDGIRAAAVRTLKEQDPERFADYGEESRLRARDLKEIQALVIESCRLEAPEAELARFKNLESLTLRQVELESFSLLGQANLKDLTIEDTPITALDLSDALSLQRLVLERTALTELDFSANRALKVLSYGGTKLGWLDFTDLPVLQYLDCSDSGITETEITGETLPNLITLRVADNPEVTSVALATFPNLAQLDCASCSIETITLADFPHLYYLRCSYNKITELDFSELRQVYAVECFGETLQKLVVTNWAEYAYADCEITRLRV